MGSKKTTNTQSTTMGSTPYATPMLGQFQEATQRSIDQGPYQGDVVAAPQIDPLMTEGWANGETAIKTINPAIQSGSQGLADYWSNVAQGHYLDPNQNTALQGYLGTFNNAAQEEFARSANNFKQGSISAGAADDTNYNRQATWMTDQFDKNTQAQLNAILYQNYMDEMARIGMADEGMAGAMSVGQMPGQIMYGIGNQRSQANQLIDQAQLTNDAARWDASQNQEIDTLAKYFQTLSNPVFGTNTTTTSTQKGGWQDVLGAAAGLGMAAFGGPSSAIAGGFMQNLFNRPQATTPFTASAPANWANFSSMVS